MINKTFHPTAIAAAFLYTGMALAQTPNPNPWMNTSLAPAQRAQLLVAAMTLDQKIQQLHGQGTSSIPEFPACGNTFRHVQGNPSLNIPTFRITNGPVGIGQGDCNPIAQATGVPSSLALASGFDPGLARMFGDMVGSEAVSVGVHVVEGPGMNMLRIPQGGRSFEYLAEDPLLAGTMAVADTTVEITIDPKAANHPLSYWDATAHDWSIAPGTYTLYVGTSSRDIVASMSHKIVGVK